MDSSPIEPQQNRWLTAPNVVTSLRIIGSPVMIVLAYQQQSMAVAILVAFLVFTEWLDGVLARTLHQHSALGARLDTVADAAFYTSLLIAIGLMFPDVTVREAWWIAAAIVSYAISWLVALIKFRTLPSYHTWLAKGAWLIVGIGIVSLVADWSRWPFRAAMLCVVLANLEAIAISLVIAEQQVDIPTIWHACQRQSGGTSSPPDAPH
ncbi:CDP-alcohol phosphatidyltransferase family protein [Bremerella sp. P1]|uniref:CDP-alcohol phosphatidyltransferase family protein n=1 Tax=Bremerella sp. P1 TaxID=3026424 RepID=UPI0023681396|nr:CDP-alcohol phosphatidyltransferase family protein [Bremerella sp. P1]WDI43964.1 CDP-alcohol phosphatidyltransferase family protein [Bremerella sp. P1]